MKKFFTPTIIGLLTLGIFYFVVIRTTKEKPQYVNL